MDPIKDGVRPLLDFFKKNQNDYLSRLTLKTKELSNNLKEMFHFVRPLDSKIRRYMNYAYKSHLPDQDIALKNKVALLKKNRDEVIRQIKQNPKSYELKEQLNQISKELKILDAELKEKAQKVKELESKRSQLTEERKKNLNIEGVSQSSAIKYGVRDAKKFLQALRRKDISGFDVGRDDLEGMRRIIKHREILNHYIKLRWHCDNIIGSRKLMVIDIKTKINALSHPRSQRVVHFGEGNSNATFSIPSKSAEHAVSYEFKYVNGEYFFVIHNRGEGINDPIHGRPVEIDGKIYMKTSVAIKVSKKQLSNPKFLQELLESEDAPTMDTAYNIIRRHLSKGGEVMESPLEAAQREAKSKGKVLSQAELKSLLAQDLYYHSIQVFETCTESSLTGPEKGLASEKTRKKLKFFSIERMANEVSDKVFSKQLDREYQEKIAEHSAQRLEKLRKEISKL